MRALQVVGIAVLVVLFGFAVWLNVAPARPEPVQEAQAPPPDPVAEARKAYIENWRPGQNVPAMLREEYRKDAEEERLRERYWPSKPKAPTAEELRWKELQETIAMAGADKKRRDAAQAAYQRAVSEAQLAAAERAAARSALADRYRLQEEAWEEAHGRRW